MSPLDMTVDRMGETGLHTSSYSDAAPGENSKTEVATL